MTLRLVLSRLFLGVFTAGLGAAILTVCELSPALILAIAIAAGVAVALVGPKLLELLMSMF